MEKNRVFFLGLFAGIVLATLLTVVVRRAALPVPFMDSKYFSKKASEKAGLSDKPVSLSPPYRYVDKAPVTLIEYADFHCPYSRLAAASLKKIMTQYPTQVRFVFRHFPSPLSSPGSGAFLTHEASACAYEQGKFWPFHDIVFDLAEPPKESDLESIAQKAGVELTRFQECLKSGKYRDSINQEIKQAKEEDLIFGTPTFIIKVANEYRSSGSFVPEPFEQLMEGILNPKKKEGTGTQVPTPSCGSGSGQAAAKGPGCGSPSGSGAAAGPAPAPQKPPSLAPAKLATFNDLEGKPSTGPKDAPVTLIEFSDFHCPFCKRVGPTIDKLVENYPKKIRRVWRHFPLSFHQGADRTHEASQCAADQGRFWEYHDKVFENQEVLSGGDAALNRLADEAGLKRKKFEECLASGKYKGTIQNDVSAGEAAGVRGTPAFFINGQLVSGAQPYENFEKIVQSELAKKS